MSRARQATPTMSKGPSTQQKKMRIFKAGPVDVRARSGTREETHHDRQAPSMPQRIVIQSKA